MPHIKIRSGIAMRNSLVPSVNMNFSIKALQFDKKGMPGFVNSD